MTLKKDIISPKYFTRILEPEFNYNDIKTKNPKLRLSTLNEKIKSNIIKSIKKSYDKKN